jgi:acyl transferase domain-containing protein/acyl carrier protein
MSDVIAHLIDNLSPETRVLLEQKLDAQREPLAIVGAGCRFPGSADSPEAFWQLLKTGVDAIREVPCDRWDVDALYDPTPQTPGKMYTRWGGFLDRVDLFDAGFFGISAREATFMDPQQRLLLEVAWESIESAGLTADDLRGSSTGVFVGVCASDYSWVQPPDPLNLEAYAATGNAHSIAANRLSYVFDLRGPSVAVDTACSSSLVSVHLACQSLWSRECSAALAGGVHLILSPLASITFSNALMMAKDGRCKTFDARADGFVRGEGCGIVVLKRLSDAIAHGDRIWAVIRGTAVNQDGRTNGLMAPSGQSQQRVVRTALQRAALDPSSVSYVEAHGTGTALGDPIEVEALAEVLRSGRAAGDRIAIGSVKTNFGHLEGAAGIAGLLKLVLAVRHGAIPPHLHFTKPNPNLAWDTLPFTIPTELCDWPAPPGQRVGGVSSFGFGGTNAHVIVQDRPEPPAETSATPDSAYLLPISARHPAALQSLVESYASRLGDRADDAAFVRDLCFSAGARRTHHDYRVFVTGRSGRDLARGLQAIQRSPAPHPTDERKARSAGLAFVFSGHGSDWLGMCRGVLAHQPVFREAIEECDRLLRQHAGWLILEELAADEAKSRLRDTEILQPVLFAIQIALARLWQTWGIAPDAVVGHSVGEIAAAHVAGALTLEDALMLAVHRGRLLQRLHGKGSMAAVACAPGEAEAILARRGSGVVIAAVNSPTSIVLSGATDALEQVLQDFEERGTRWQLLPMPYAFHSPQTEPLQEEFVAAVASLRPSATRVHMASTVTGAFVGGQELDAGYWCRNVRGSVRFASAIAELRARGVTRFLEVAPHPILARPIAECCADAELFWSLRRNEDDEIGLLANLGKLYACGCPIAWRSLYGNGAAFIDLPRYPWQRERFWVEAGRRKTLPFSDYFSGAQGAAANRTPVLGTRVALPTRDVVYENRFTSWSPSFLKDHQLKGLLIAPAVGYVEMALESAAELLGPPPYVIENFSIFEPLILSARNSRFVQTVLKSESDGKISFQIFSRRDDDDESEDWRRHVMGSVRRERAAPDAGRDALEAIKSRCAQEIPVDAYYQFLRDRGFEYGPTFRGIKQLWRGTAEALGRVQLIDESGPNKYQIHPGVLEACLQTVGGLADRIEATEGFIYVPIGIEGLRFAATPRTALWSHATIRPIRDPQPETIVADVRILDEAGSDVIEARGLQFKRATLLTAAAQVQPDWFYEIAWQPIDAPDPAADWQPGSWLVFDDGGTAAREVCEYLRGVGQTAITVTWGERFASAGADAFTLDPRTPDDFGLLFDAPELTRAPLQGALYFWTRADARSDADARAVFESTVDRECAGLFHLAQRLLQRRSSDTLRRLLWLVTEGAQIVRPDAPAESLPSGDAVGTWPEVNQSLAWGMMRTLLIEHPEICGGAIDRDPNETLDPVSLFERIRARNNEVQLARRRGAWYAARLVRSRRRRAGAAPFLRDDATYLITGGLGSLGLQVAQSCVQRGARHVALLGRTPPSEPARSSIEALEATGAKILTLQADVADVGQLRAALETIAASMPPLGGIVHAAGTLADGLLASHEWSRFSTVFAPKVFGGWNLHELTRQMPLDFFVTFSSIASVLGSPAQANYAAANAFLDALAHARRAQGLPAISINWGPWAGGGMAARDSGADRRWSDEGLGIRAFSPEQALHALADVLGRDTTQVSVMSVNWPRFTRLFYGVDTVPFLSEIADRDATGQDGDGVKGQLLEELRNAHPAERRDLLIARVRERIVAVLGLESGDDLAAHRGFFDMGMDSLMALELKNALQNDLAITIAPTVVFEHPTIESLADYLVSDVLALETREAAPAPAVVDPTLAAKIEELLATADGPVADHELLERIEQLSDEEVEQMLAGLVDERDAGRGQPG